MKIVKILGGLGNQMFQYALAIALKEKFPDEDVLIDTACFRGYNQHNGFELSSIFHLDCKIASWKDVAKVAYPYPNYRCWLIGKRVLPRRKTMCVENKSHEFDETILSQKGNRYFDGYWQHEEYFCFAKSNLLKALKFPPPTDIRNVKTIRTISAINSVSIHIRRGDYVNHPYFKGICDLDYYKRAIRYMEENVSPDMYCVFSNDIEWCKHELARHLPADKTVYVNWNTDRNSYVDLQIMSHCKHNIIANSSFSWWSAWLNRNPQKVVLAPKRWKNCDTMADPVPQKWIRI